MGLTIATFIIENISVPPEVEAALDKRTQMGILGDLGRYTQLQAANAMEAAASNPGGGGEGVGLGVGMALGQQMARSLSQPDAGGQGQPAGQQSGPSGPPPLPAQTQWFLGVGGQQQGPFDADGLRRSGAQRHADAGDAGLEERAGGVDAGAGRPRTRAGARRRAAAATAAVLTCTAPDMTDRPAGARRCPSSPARRPTTRRPPARHPGRAVPAP